MRKAIRAIALAATLVSLPALADCGTPSDTDAGLVATPRAAAAIDDARGRLANPDGRLWRIGTEPPSYLIGTFHIASGGIEDPGPVLTELVGGAAELFVEIDQPAMDATLAEWAKDPARLFRGAGDRLSDDLTDDEMAKAETLLAKYGVPFVLADQMRPLFLVGLLSVPPCAVAEAQTPGLDAALERIARDAGIPVTALETVEEQTAALEGEPGELDATLRMMLTQAVSYEDDWFLYLALYRTGHVGAIWTLGRQTMVEEVGEAEADAVATAFWDRLVARRNVNMVERMLPALREGNRVVAVGALHLPGADGIVELLRARGLTVTRIDDAGRDDDARPAAGGEPRDSTKGEAAPDEAGSADRPPL